jgi:hypothetical protein
MSTIEAQWKEGQHVQVRHAQCITPVPPTPARRAGHHGWINQFYFIALNFSLWKISHFSRYGPIWISQYATHPKSVESNSRVEAQSSKEPCKAWSEVSVSGGLVRVNGWEKGSFKVTLPYEVMDNSSIASPNRVGHNQRGNRIYLKSIKFSILLLYELLDINNSLPFLAENFGPPVSVKFYRSFWRTNLNILFLFQM